MSDIADAHRMNTEKRCTKCSRLRAVIDYYKQPNTPDGLAYVCIACKRIYARDYRLSNPQAIREYMRVLQAKAIDELDTNYVKQLLVKGSRIRRTQLPQALIDMKREALRLKRLARQLTRATKENHESSQVTR